jgi:hypothetical protein
MNEILNLREALLFSRARTVTLMAAKYYPIAPLKKSVLFMQDLYKTKLKWRNT